MISNSGTKDFPEASCECGKTLITEQEIEEGICAFCAVNAYLSEAEELLQIQVDWENSSGD